jgi:hypothetical protein
VNATVAISFLCESNSRPLFITFIFRSVRPDLESSASQPPFFYVYHLRIWPISCSDLEARRRAEAAARTIHNRTRLDTYVNVPLHLQPPPPVPPAHFKHANRKFRRTASKVALALGLASASAAKNKKKKSKKLKKKKAKQAAQSNEAIAAVAASSTQDRGDGGTATATAAAATADLRHLSQLTLSVEQLATLLQRVVNVSNSASKNASSNVANGPVTPFNTPFGKAPVNGSNSNSSSRRTQSTARANLTSPLQPGTPQPLPQSQAQSQSQHPSHSHARHSDAWNEIAATHAAHERAALNEAGFQSAVAYYSHDESAPTAQFASPSHSARAKTGSSRDKRRSANAASNTPSSSSSSSAAAAAAAASAAAVPWSPVPALLRPDSPIAAPAAADASPSAADDAASAAVMVDSELAAKAHAAYAEPLVNAYLPLRVMLPRQLVVLGEIPFVFYKMVAVVGNRCMDCSRLFLSIPL